MANVDLSRDELETLYTSKYFAGEEYKDYVAERRLIEKHFRIRLKTLLRYVPGSQGKSVFEIGSAYGFFLSVAKEHFRSAAGIDISRDAATYAVETLKLDVSIGDFSDYSFRQQPDVVCLWDTIEHLQRPDLYVEKVARHLRPGGIVAITTGDIGSPVARWRGARWRQIHPPTHLHYFSKSTLTRLLQNHGFRIRYCGYEGMFRNVDSMAYMILVLRNQQPRLYEAIKKTGLLSWDLYLNLYDIMYLIAEKAS
jgi:2-polyprenyl-3-methyl-5-hydroxy-6-metoxy-1,4-benzoquinol methylase